MKNCTSIVDVLYYYVDCNNIIGLHGEEILPTIPLDSLNSYVSDNLRRNAKEEIVRLKNKLSTWQGQLDILERSQRNSLLHKLNKL